MWGSEAQWQISKIMEYPNTQQLTVGILKISHYVSLVHRVSIMLYFSYFVITVKTLECIWQCCEAKWGQSCLSSKTDNSQQMEKPVQSTFPLLFCWFVYFWFPYKREPLELGSAERPRHNMMAAMDERDIIGTGPPRRAAGGLIEQDARNGSGVPAARASDT